jgi:tRNA uridine 5-carbamoylmethylation protein Kti12
MQLIIFTGLPGAGKSSIAEPGHHDRLGVLLAEDIVAALRYCP